MRRQGALAAEYGIDGFVMHHYWFDGRPLLEQPLRNLLDDPTIDFPFALCWSNENWTRRWDGLEHEVLMQQVYGLADSRLFFESLVPLFRDARYIRVDGRPLLLVYKASLIPELAQTVAQWRTQAREAGFPDVYLVACQTVGETDPVRLGFDAGCEFPPHGHNAIWLNARMRMTNAAFTGLVTSYKSQVVQSLERPAPPFKLFRTVMPAWDNTARRQDRATTFVGSSPELFGYWVERMAAQTRERLRGDERLLFVNAWNEWGEGCHLEPDERYGRQYLEAFARGLRA
jgi:lipopolysaccharide biosynthesis protein